MIRSFIVAALVGGMVAVGAPVQAVDTKPRPHVVSERKPIANPLPPGCWWNELGTITCGRLVIGVKHPQPLRWIGTPVR